MGDERPGIAIGHVSFGVKAVAEHVAFFETLGIRTIFSNDDYAVQELRGGTHLVLRVAQDIDTTAVAFDVMVDDVDAWRRKCIAANLSASEISRGRIHASFEVTTPDGRALRITSSHAGNRPV